MLYLYFLKKNACKRIRPADPPFFLTAQDSCSCSTHERQHHKIRISSLWSTLKGDFFFSEQKENQTGMWWINDQLSPCWSNVSRPKLWLYGKWLLHFSSKCLCSPAGSSAELPEGVSEVHTPSLQLLWVVGRHVGELSEDVEVRGVSWWRKKKHRM